MLPPGAFDVAWSHLGMDRAAGGCSAVSTASCVCCRHLQWLGQHACCIWSVGPTNKAVSMSTAALRRSRCACAKIAARKLYGRQGLHSAWTGAAIQPTRRTRTIKGERHGEGPATRQSRSQEAGYQRTPLLLRCSLSSKSEEALHEQYRLIVGRKGPFPRGRSTHRGEVEKHLPRLLSFTLYFK